MIAVVMLWFLSFVGCLSIVVGAATYLYIRRERTGRIKNTWNYVIGIVVVGWAAWYYTITTAAQTFCSLPN